MSLDKHRAVMRCFNLRTHLRSGTILQTVRWNRVVPITATETPSASGAELLSAPDHYPTSLEVLLQRWCSFPQLNGHNVRIASISPLMCRILKVRPQSVSIEAAVAASCQAYALARLLQACRPSSYSTCLCTQHQHACR